MIRFQLRLLTTVRCAGLLCVAAAGASFIQAAPMFTNNAPPPVEPIRSAPFLGWEQAIRLQNERLEAILVPALGRVVHLAPRNGLNLLRLDPALQGQVPPANDPFFNIGGDWLWPVAQARWKELSANGTNWPPPAVLAEHPWENSAWTDAEGAACALLSREYGAPLHIQVSRLFRLEPGAARLTVRQRIERRAPSEIPVVLWSISQVDRADQIVLPVSPDSRFRGGIKALLGRKPSRTHLVPCKSAAVYRVGGGRETKLGSDCPRGWIAAARENNILIETVVNSAAGDYPDGGCVVEMFSNAAYGYSEIETLSPEVDLAPGQVLENILMIGHATVETPDDPCALAEAVRAAAEN
jgi:hypothetical protein